ncbi:SMP-30/gluconolactonase/LRE family protein [Parasphingopyxis marina]|uniref:Uncharacterized protein n=1 Tax=Parasphingopyxis marina TaxID=2761622 RepID=A0A842I2D1_9SPHN|nr:hypothetical protein [Parasphingopyxis marina]MBC2778893.1 hypothetical protein [Parasphingopyxis marina]
MEIRAPSGILLRTIALPYDRNDGLVILEDGGFLVSSIRGSALLHVATTGAVSEIAGNIPDPASIGYDPVRRRAIVPQLWTNGIMFVDISELP